MSEKISASTDEIRKKQEEWLDIFDRIRTGFDQINELMSNLNQVFMGKPIESIKSRENGMREEVEVCLEQLREHLQKLTQISAIYDQAEEENKNVITSN